MLNVDAMKAEVTKALADVLSAIQMQFRDCFDRLTEKNQLKLPRKKSEGALYEITDSASLDKVPNAPGFYVIFSSWPMANDDCKLTLPDGRRALYRGEGRFVRRRLESHLFNATHHKLHRQRVKSNPSEPNYRVCMKIQDGTNGVNLDKSPYDKERWAVLFIRLSDSSSLIRKQAEIAFDRRFGQPAASRDVARKVKDAREQLAQS